MKAILVVFTRAEQTKPRFRVVHSNQLEEDVHAITEYLNSLKGLTIHEFNVGVVEIDDDVDAYKGAEDKLSRRIIANTLTPTACRLLGVELPPTHKPPASERRPILSAGVAKSLLNG